MKQSIGVVLFAALVCSITQTGFAADFTLKMQGLRINKLSADVKVNLYCNLYNSNGNIVMSKVRTYSPALDADGTSNVISAPFDFEVGDSHPLRDTVRRWSCFIKLKTQSGQVGDPTACPNGTRPAGVEAFQCVDPSSFHLLQAGGTITP